MLTYSHFLKSLAAFGITGALLSGSARTQSGAAPTRGVTAQQTTPSQGSTVQPSSLPTQQSNAPQGSATQPNAIAPQGQQLQPGLSPSTNGTTGFPSIPSIGSQNSGTFPSTNGTNNLPGNAGSGLGQSSNPGLASVGAHRNNNGVNGFALPNAASVGLPAGAYSRCPMAQVWAPLTHSSCRTAPISTAVMASSCPMA